jgi:WD40 repeat protein
MFDPYHKWLGIPKDQRPPTHYQLLGIAPNETDAEVIDEATLRQTTHIRAYQIGPHAAECTRILNEIAQAKLTLVHPAKRKAYDEQLAKAKASQITAQLPMATAVAPPPTPTAFSFDEADERPIARVPRRDLNVAKPANGLSALHWTMLGAGGAVVLLALAIVVVVVARRPMPAPVPPGPVAKKEDDKPNPKIPEVLKQPVNPPPIIDNPPPMKKPPVVVQQPPNNPPAGDVAVPGARSFKVGENRIEWLSLSPDGSKVALSFLNPSVYEVATGKQLAMFPPRKFGGIVRTPVAFLPDNARVLYAYGSESGDASVGDVATGKALFVLEQEKVQYASALAVDHDGKRALVAHNYSLVYWDLEKQQMIKRWSTKGIIDEVVFTPDGRGAVTGEKSGVVVTWDLNPDQLKPHRQFTAPNELRSLAVAADGATIAAGSKGGIALMDVRTQQVKTIHSPPFSGAVAFCSGGKQILAGDTDGEIRFFDVALAKYVGTLRGHKKEVTRIAVDAKENIAVSGDATGKVVVWPLAAALLAKAPPAAANPADPLAAPPPGLKKIADRSLIAVYRLAIMPDGKSFISGGWKLTHWDISGVPIQQIAKKNATGNRLAMNLSADGRLVAWGENKDNPTLFEVATGREVGRMPSEAMLSAMALSPDGTRWCAGFDGKSFTVWDVAKQKSIQEVALANQPFCLAFAPDGKHLLASVISGQSQWYDTTTWQPLGDFSTGPFPSHPAFTPDGQTLALVSVRGIHLFDMGKIQPIAELPHKQVQYLAFCAKGQLLLAVAANESAIAVWDPVQRAKVALWELPEPIHAFAVDPQETFILAVTRSGHCYTWPLPKTRADLK